MTNSDTNNQIHTTPFGSQPDIGLLDNQDVLVFDSIPVIPLTEQDELWNQLQGRLAVGDNTSGFSTDIRQSYGEFDQGVINGNSGNDTITIQGTGHVQAYGKKGNDDMFITGRNVFAGGGAGDDTIKLVHEGDYAVEGVKQYFMHGNTFYSTDYLESDQLTARGGSGNDNITGSNWNDTLRGDGGNDLLFGGKGNDRLLGGAGNDYLEGGEGNDVLLGGKGSNTYWGGAGADQFGLQKQHEWNSIADFNHLEGDTILIREEHIDSIQLQFEEMHFGAAVFTLSTDMGVTNIHSIVGDTSDINIMAYDIMSAITAT